MTQSETPSKECIAESSRVIQLQNMLAQLSEISQALSTEKNLQQLLKHIMDTAVQLTGSDAGSLYLVVDSETHQLSHIQKGNVLNHELLFVYAKNYSVEIDFEAFYTPILKESYNGYAISMGQAVRIDDAYRRVDDLPYHHNRSFDVKTGYESHSVLTIPMKNHQNAIIGAIQLINKKMNIEEKLFFQRSDDAQTKGFDDEQAKNAIISYTNEDERLMSAFASQAAVAIENNQLYQEQLRMLNDQRVLNDTLTVLNKQLIDLSKKILTAHEDERKRMARDIHDGPAQTVVNLNLKTEITKKYLEKGDVGAAMKQLDLLQVQVQDASKDIRNIIYNLKPSWLDDGLYKAVRSRVSVFEESTGVQTKVETIGDDQMLPQYVTAAVFQMIQEALTNVSKYAEASHVSVKLQVSSLSLLVEIVDNGKGFDLETVVQKMQNRKAGSGFGLEGMKERITLLRGDLKLISSIGNGTKISIELPL